jgi:integrase/recombinase XerD
MTDTPLLGPWLRRFLLEHLVKERNLSQNTRLSYRDTLVLLLLCLTRRLHRPPDRLTVLDISPDLVHGRVAPLLDPNPESASGGDPFAGSLHRNAQSGVYRVVRPDALHPMKKTTRILIPYLEKPEMDALLEAPDGKTAQGRRDRTLLFFLYNSGRRADEAAQLTIADLQLGHPPQKGQSWINVMGKGRKRRPCPYGSRRRVN